MTDIGLCLALAEYSCPSCTPYRIVQYRSFRSKSDVGVLLNIYILRPDSRNLFRETCLYQQGVPTLLEEVAQEVLTWGGGSHLFNEHYSPVILEGRLVSTFDGKTLWSDTAFSSIDKKALKKLPEDEQKKKVVQLKVTTDKTEHELVASLEKAVQKHR